MLSLIIQYVHGLSDWLESRNVVVEEADAGVLTMLVRALRRHQA